MSRVGSEHDVAGSWHQEMPPSERPMERLLEFGPEAVSTAELIAVIIRCGRPGESAVDVAVRVLSKCGTARKLATAGVHELLSIPGIGPVRAARMVSRYRARQKGCSIRSRSLLFRVRRCSGFAHACNALSGEGRVPHYLLGYQKSCDRQCNHLSGHTELFHSASEGGIQGGYSCR